MRFRSRTAAAGRVYAVTGTNTVSFAVVASDTTKAGLLGFAVRRYDLAAGTDEWMPGFKVFRSLIAAPTAGETRQHVRPASASFTWDDFTCHPDSRYRYVFHPLKGTAEKLVRVGHAAHADDPHRAVVRRATRRVLQPRRREQSGLHPALRQHPHPGPRPRPPEAGARLAESRPRRRTAEVHRAGTARRPALGLLLRVHLRARRHRIEEGHRQPGRRPAHRRRQAERLGDGAGVPARGEPRDPGRGRDHDAELPAPRGADVGDRAQQVHGAHPGRVGPDAGLDRIHQPHPWGYRRTDERRALGPRPRHRPGVPELLEPARQRSRRPVRRHAIGRPRQEQGVPRRRGAALAGAVRPARRFRPGSRRCSARAGRPPSSTRTPTCSTPPPATAASRSPSASAPGSRRS